LESFDIELYKTRPELIRQTVDQVVKDFAMFGMEVSFSGNMEMAYDELFTQLSTHLARLLAMDANRLAALLYQIDLGPHSVLEAEYNHPGWSRPDIISELVIYRELKKVLLRNYFRNQKSQG